MAHTKTDHRAPTRLLSLHLGRAPSLTDSDHNLPLPAGDPVRLAQLSLGRLFSKLVTTLYGLKMHLTRTPVQIEALQEEMTGWSVGSPSSFLVG